MYQWNGPCLGDWCTLTLSPPIRLGKRTRSPIDLRALSFAYNKYSWTNISGINQQLLFNKYSLIIEGYQIEAIITAGKACLLLLSHFQNTLLRIPGSQAGGSPHTLAKTVVALSPILGKCPTEVTNGHHSLNLTENHLRISSLLTLNKVWFTHFFNNFFWSGVAKVLEVAKTNTLMV